MTALTSMLTNLRGRQDLMLIGLLVMTIIMMILPMPTAVIDVLIAVSISLTVLVLMVSIYLQRPDDFSTFPAIILIATVYRLAISISTTRMILSQADAGQIIETFGTFVTAGNVIVGLVIFLIITTVQFVVITKGSERVAEVAARFVLDALPGRQLSIDAELRSGDITQDDARHRRRRLDRENQFFGAMDGAMKFIKGDAIAGLIIIAVNLLGGIAVGTLQHNMSVSEAVDVYSRLTVGDGLVAQIPALFMALCAGAVITRVTTDEKTDLGSDITRQLVGSSRSLLVAAVAVTGMGFVPGFPTMVFLLIGAGLAALGIMLQRRENAIANAEPGSDPSELSQEQIPVEVRAQAQKDDPLVLRVSQAVAEKVDLEKFVARRDALTKIAGDRSGFDQPFIGLSVDPYLHDQQVEMDLDDVPLFSGTIPSDCVMVRCESEVLELAGIAATPISESWPFRSSFWVADPASRELEAISVEVLESGEILAELGSVFLSRNAGSIIGFNQIRLLIESLQASHPQLAEQISQTTSPPKLVEILRRLAAEGVPLRPQRVLFESIAETSLKEDDPAIIAEQVRQALRRQICQYFADSNRVIAGYLIEPDFEQQLRDSIQHTEAGSYLSMPSRLSDVMLEQLEQVSAPSDIDAKPPVIVTTIDLRRFVYGYLDAHNIRVHVLSFQEVAPEFHLQPIGVLSSSNRSIDMAENSDSSQPD